MDGLIYKVQPYLEHSKLLYTYTKYGKVTLIAQGVQKINNKERTLAQYLNQISFDYNPLKTMYRLTNGKLLNSYETIKQSFNKVKSAALILELIEKAVIADEVHDWIYQNAIEALNYDVDYSGLAFAIKLLRVLGHHLQLNPDGRKISGFSLTKSALVYKEELSGVDLDIKQTQTLLELAMLPYEKINIIDGKTLTIIKTFIYNYYEYYLEIKLKTLE